MESILDFDKTNNIFEILTSPSFDKINSVSNFLVKLSDNPLTKQFCKLSHPKIIVCGDESSGSTSLIKKITGHNFFPRNTKTPVHLITRCGDKNVAIKYDGCDTHYTNNNIIFDEINNFMDEQYMINDKKITIELTDINLPNLHLYNLPSMLLHDRNQKISDKIVKIYQKYLRGENTIILCTVPATIPNILSSKTVQLIKNMGLQKNCIIVLTMVDLLHPYSIETNVIKRISKNNNEITNDNFISRVAVINKYCNNLKESYAYENNWFATNIINSEIDIKNNSTVHKLLCIISSFYKKNIEHCYKIRLTNILECTKNNLIVALKSIDKQSITREELKTLLYDGIGAIKSDLNPCCNVPKLSIDTSSRINMYWSLRSSIDKHISNSVDSFLETCFIYKIKRSFEQIHSSMPTDNHSPDFNNSFAHYFGVSARFIIAMEELYNNINIHIDALKKIYLKEIIITIIQYLNNLSVTYKLFKY